ncbi:uncharacterized protein LOC123507494 isoform X2 [Portunus trituberculatus]|nr:uncharacterized protein LOC123507494 isoform X2 [Portunus trituberculatus]
MEAALDLVEDTLATLRKRVEQEEERGRGRGRDAATNTTPPPPPPSITSSKAAKKPRNKSVLIKRKTKYKAKRTRQVNTSEQASQGTQREKTEAPHYCKHCNPRKDREGIKQTEKTSRPSSIDPKLANERVVWKPAQKDHREQEPDTSQDCLCYGNTLCDNPCPVGRERVIWKHRTRDRKEESQNTYHDCCLCHSDTNLPLRSARTQQDDIYEHPGSREEVFGKRGHSKHRRDKSDSSCHSTPRKTHKAARPRHTDTGGRSRERKTSEKSYSSCHNSCKTHREARPRHTAQGNDTDTSQSRERKASDKSDSCNSPHKTHRSTLSPNPRQTGIGRSRERKMRGTESQVKGHLKISTHSKAAVDVEKQGYARPTHTSQQRVKQSHPKEKENIIPYIPCGAKSHSFHIGVTAQQEIGRLLNQPPPDLTHTHSNRSSGRPEGAATKGLTQEILKQAMTNIHHHLKGHTDH